MPTNPALCTAQVVRSVRLSPSFQRVTVGGDDLTGFPWVGFDQWFRLFLPPGSTAPLVLPGVAGGSWWKPYLAIPEGRRPHCSNYTVAARRRTATGVEIDIDVVLHWDESDQLAGQVAIWAATTTAGAPLALLDQGRLFDPPDHVTDLHLVTDETGLPAVRGILRDLAADSTGTAVIEVPTPDDVVEMSSPTGVEVLWVSRDGTRSRPGDEALGALALRRPPGEGDYAFVVGESRLATRGRRLLHQRGLAKSRITFSGFWREHAPEDAS